MECMSAVFPSIPMVDGLSGTFHYYDAYTTYIHTVVIHLINVMYKCAKSMTSTSVFKL